MQNNNTLTFIKKVVANMPKDWLELTTHRLDIYDEKMAKTEFLNQFEKLFESNNADTTALINLPTAYDYIRLGHPLSSILEWGIAKLNNLQQANVISFSSKTIPIYAVLRKNLLDKKNTLITYKDKLPLCFDVETLKRVYGYQFELKKINNVSEINDFKGSIIYISQQNEIGKFELQSSIDFQINLHSQFGSILIVNGKQNENYISEIQHVRRRETIAMTPTNCLYALHQLLGNPIIDDKNNVSSNKMSVINSIKKITGTNKNALIGSSGLSIQYAIMMGLIDNALEKYPEKTIHIVVPPNCYGGTNDQARRLAKCLTNVEIVDLAVDGNNNMVQSTNIVLEQAAIADAIPLIIAEIPTNPRVEVPNLIQLKDVLSKKRKTSSGKIAVEPVFILDQTFCPNVQFLKEGGILSTINSISYVSGSKFPSGGKCTAGYCVANKNAESLLTYIEKHLILCDNEATIQQLDILALQIPSMNQRIKNAYFNTLEFVNFIKATLPKAKINFVSEEIAKQGFTPSVFSLDLPTKGNTDKERENYKRELNQKLINMMISKIPNESKYCVSYGQLKGCYWTIPATSTQGTTKEGDKDYIARVAISPDLNLELHKKVFLDFVNQITS
ncbi:MAG: cystathionine beta-synthase [Vicingaceae bacterium]|nr:cystathionine beta-synthase [Vicingaceae bacterium]